MTRGWLWGACAMVVAAACGKPATVSKATGTATFDSKPIAIAGCTVEKAGDPPRTTVVIRLANGMRYRSSVDGPRFDHGDGTWTHPTCSRIAADDHIGDGWATGTLGASCDIDGKPFIVDATFDCGVVDRPPPRTRN